MNRIVSKGNLISYVGMAYLPPNVRTVRTAAHSTQCALMLRVSEKGGEPSAGGGGCSSAQAYTRGGVGIVYISLVKSQAYRGGGGLHLISTSIHGGGGGELTKKTDKCKPEVMHSTRGGGGGGSLRLLNRVFSDYGNC